MYTRSNDEFSNDECDDFPSEFGEGYLEDSEEFEGDGSDGSDGSSDDALDVFDFLPSFPTHAPIRSIEFVIASPCRQGTSYTPVLAHCLEKCLPGTLTKLVLRGKSDDSMQYVLPSTKQSEAVWLLITTLHVSGGIRPPWESNAFKGLTDLRLSHSRYDSIPESKFVNILRSSPKLRILQFHLSIARPSPLNKPVEPIHLNDLEVLDLIENHNDQTGELFETLTRWIAPSQRPLRLTLWCPLDSDPVKNFFRRSNVTELHVRLHGNTADSLEKLLDLSPQLRMLAVDGCGGHFNPRSATKAGDGSHAFAQIDTLHLQYCTTQFDLLQRMVQKRSIRTLTMWSSHIRRGQFGGVSDEEILALCPNSKILKRKEFTNMEKWIKSIV
ncbi:hypothetical protein FRC11_002692 [Ceratobasidium sp. 423]|nr:hypothetical protein FRC11_002692 [Ceratobasidium sp. 423]